MTPDGQCVGAMAINMDLIFIFQPGNKFFYKCFIAAVGFDLQRRIEIDTGLVLLLEPPTFFHIAAELLEQEGGRQPRLSLIGIAQRII